jgi:hypothetical protein
MSETPLTYVAVPTTLGVTICVPPPQFQQRKTTTNSDFHLMPYRIRKDGLPLTLVCVVYIEGEQLLSRDDWTFTLEDIRSASTAVEDVRYMEAIHARHLRKAVEQGFNAYLAAKLRGE